MYPRGSAFGNGNVNEFALDEPFQHCAVAS